MVRVFTFLDSLLISTSAISSLANITIKILKMVILLEEVVNVLKVRIRNGHSRVKAHQ